MVNSHEKENNSILPILIGIYPSHKMKSQPMQLDLKFFLSNHINQTIPAFLIIPAEP